MQTAQHVFRPLLKRVFTGWLIRRGASNGKFQQSDSRTSLQGPCHCGASQERQYGGGEFEAAGEGEVGCGGGATRKLKMLQTLQYQLSGRSDRDRDHAGSLSDPRAHAQVLEDW